MAHTYSPFMMAKIPISVMSRPAGSGTTPCRQTTERRASTKQAKPKRPRNPGGFR